MTKAHLQATILVADDDTTIRTNLRLLLQSEGYRVLEAADGLQAAQAFGDPSVALALLDLKMPGQDGMDLLRKHQDQLEEMPVIVITALGGSAAAIEAMKLGAYDYITKPFDLDEVALHRTAGLDTECPGRPGGSTDDCSAGRCRLLK